ncbi:jg4299, partial [Pararge aegeria aegeria]
MFPGKGEGRGCSGARPDCTALRAKKSLLVHTPPGQDVREYRNSAASVAILFLQKKENAQQPSINKT